jgi:pimeloyl-ACP methyl ester carboxylesterase
VLDTKFTRSHDGSSAGGAYQSMSAAWSSEDRSAYLDTLRTLEPDHAGPASAVPARRRGEAGPSARGGIADIAARTAAQAEHNRRMTLRRVLQWTIVIVVVVVVVLTVAWFFQRKLIYVPDTASPGAPPRGATEVTMPTSDGLELTGWVFAPTGADRSSAVLVANGNGGNRAGRVGLAEVLAAKGFTVLLFDYRGYGGNSGSPSQGGLYADGAAAYSYLTEEAGFRPQRLLYFGESLGCGVVSHLAVDHPPAGMLLRSPFTDLPAAGQRLYPYLPVRLLLSDVFPVEHDVAKAEVPLVVAYGSADELVPAQLSRQVAASAERAGAPVTTVVVPGAGHNDPGLATGRRVVDGFVALADRLGLTADQPAK